MKDPQLQINVVLHFSPIRLEMKCGGFLLCCLKASLQWKVYLRKCFKRLRAIC